MNLSRFDTRETSEDGKWLDILDWDWETKIGFKIKILGPDSMEAAKIADEEEKQFQATLADLYARGKKPSITVTELSVQRAVEKAARLTLDWEGGEWEGKPFPFSHENAIMLYTNCSHIRTQVLSYHASKINFTKGESSNSVPSSDSDSRSTTHAKKER